MPYILDNSTRTNTNLRMAESSDISNWNCTLTTDCQPTNLVGLFLILFIVVVSLVGNFTAIYYTRKNANTIVQTLLFHVLACTDVLTSLLTSPLVIASYLSGRWVGGQFGCKYECWAINACGCFAGVVIVVIAIERWIALTQPYEYEKIVTIPKMKKALIALGFIYGTFFISPTLGFGHVRIFEPGTYCNIDWFATQTEDRVFAAFCIGIILSCVVIVIACNIHVIIILNRLRLQRRKLEISSTAAAERKLKRSDSETSMAKIMIIITICYCICWLPVAIRYIYNQSGLPADPAADTTAFRLATFNVVFNPIILLALKKEFRVRLHDGACVDDHTRASFQRMKQPCICLLDED
ncbi:uncharacterized protein TRIADDRAFT_58786 [Trichoplax adhaerens]|uniref:G-protein coupled receptors family 1 profile domain-containing protein n=1 Tax=Trichoplax adhaerens TaxID=10228 RepID=B3S3N4_TRIAD|nr:hypothetical protein TRIADDRAFT_58786 [Trichoplax adhaerens]EDV22308.1 hypothetical protein TRIADDRAFT_58786 [Trichoplax adhaerens]|eukprot:XP_002114852.1 hypothetical protein TRIADDRAFT_58786 [Trichoplax adhaerens]